MGVNRVIKWAFDQYVGLGLSVMSRYPIGTNVFEQEWDTLILLDTCRVDALREVAPEFSFLPSPDDIDSLYSIASGSYTWMANTFVKDYIDDIRDTVYVSANGYSQRVLKDGWNPEDDRGISFCNWHTVTSDDLLALDQPWQHGKGTLGHTKPDYVTKRAVAHAQEYNPDRLIVHYSQPHEPYIASALSEGRKERDELHDYERDPWSYLRSGGSREKIWKEYLNDLRMVLEEVEVLLNNHDAERVVISADHGESFGEWAVYRHPVAVLHPKIRHVPWAYTSAEDSGNIDVEIDKREQMSSVEENLRDLGYL